MKLKGFVSGAYESQSRIVAGEQCINLFPEFVPSGNKARGALFPAPGLSTFATVNDSPGRGIFLADERLFAVFGTTLYEISSAGVATDRGTVAMDGNPVTMEFSGDAGNELFICSGDSGYIFDLGTNLLTLEVADVTQGGHLDGFFVALDGASSTLKISDLVDGLTWDATQVAQRSGAADPWIAMIIANQEIFLAGTKTSEFWYNAGLSPFPFAMRDDAVIDVGIAAANSLARFGSSFAWLGRSSQGSGTVYQMNGYTPTPISTPAIEWAIKQYEASDGISDAIGWSYEREGHSFYVLTFPAADRTWVYDSTTNLWHQRDFWDSQANDWSPYRARFHAHAYNRNLVCDGNSNRIYSLSSTVYTDADGNGIRRVRRTPHLSDENRRLFFPWAELECARGVGLSTGQGSDPTVVLRYSNDGGQTWGTERERSVGALGEYGERVRWEMCGSGRDRVWELWSSDPVATHWFDFYVGVS